MFDARSRSLLIIATLVSVGSACGAEIGVPEDVHVPIILKILTYDRALRRNSTDQIRIGIIHSPGNRDSQRNGRRVQESLSANSEKTINGLTFDFTSMPFTSPADLDSSLSHGDFSVLYITCGNSANLKAITTISQKHRCLTVTGVAEYVHAGASIGLGVENRRPRILVNLCSAKAEGADLSANLLALCKVIR